jgi:3-oxoadipate enol-lactonase
VLSQLGITGPAAICGLSMGGYISFALYRSQPQLFSAMILAATRAGADSDQARANRDKAILNTIEHGPQQVIDDMLKILLAPINYQKKPELVASLEKIMSMSTPAGIVAALEGMKARPDSTPLLNQIKVPTLIFQGADDQIIPAGEAEIMDSEIPDSKLVMIPDAGHMLNMEQAEIFNHEVARFLDSI